MTGYSEDEYKRLMGKYNPRAPLEPAPKDVKNFLLGLIEAISADDAYKEFCRKGVSHGTVEGYKLGQYYLLKLQELYDNEDSLEGKVKK